MSATIVALARDELRRMSKRPVESLRLGDTATIALTGLRNPCRKLEGIAPGLMAAVPGKGRASSSGVRRG